MEYAIIQELSRGQRHVVRVVDRDAESVRVELAHGDLPLGFELATGAAMEPGDAFRLVSTARRDQGGGTMALARGAAPPGARKVFALPMRPPRRLVAPPGEGAAAWTCPAALDLPVRQR